MSKIKTSIIIVIILLTIALILILIYYSPKLSPYYFKINNLLYENDINPIEYQKDLLQYPLHRFYINTSHNTYLNSIQHVVPTTTYGYIFALNAGARYIEIDISTKNGKPEVCHGSSEWNTTTKLDLMDVLNTINQNAFNNSDPLIIHVELLQENNENVNKIIKDMFISVFGNKIYLPTDSDFTQIPIEKLLNRVVIIGRYNLKYISDIMTDSPFLKNYSSSISELKEKKKDDNYITRVYPDGNLQGALSKNLDSNEFRKYYCNCIAMNFQTRDRLLYENLQFFKNSSFVLM